MAATFGLNANFWYAWLAFRDSSGYPMGTLATPNAPVNGTTYAPYLITHPVTFTPPTPTRGTATLRAGQVIMLQTDTGVETYGTGQLVLGAEDETFATMINGSSVDSTTMTGWTTTSENAANPNLPQLVLGIVKGFTTAAGAIEYSTRVYHNCQIQPVVAGASQNSGVNPNPLTYNIVPSTSLRQGIGRLFSASALAVTRNIDMSTSYRYTAPIYPVTYIDDGSTGHFSFPYRPTTSDATGAATNSITKNGATLIVTSVSTTTGLVTQTAAATAADKIVAALPTLFVAL